MYSESKHALMTCYLLHIVHLEEVDHGWVIPAAGNQGVLGQDVPTIVNLFDGQGCRESQMLCAVLL